MRERWQPYFPLQYAPAPPLYVDQEGVPGTVLTLACRGYIYRGNRLLVKINISVFFLPTAIFKSFSKFLFQSALALFGQFYAPIHFRTTEITRPETWQGFHST